MKASEAFRDTFGSEVKELNAGAIVSELRREIARHEDRQLHLPLTEQLIASTGFQAAAMTT